MTELSSGISSTPNVFNLFAAPKDPNSSTLGELTALMRDTKSQLAITHIGPRIFSLEVGQIHIGIAEALETRRIAAVTLFPLLIAHADGQSTGSQSTVRDILTTTLFARFDPLVYPLGTLYEMSELRITPVEGLFESLQRFLKELDSQVS